VAVSIAEAAFFVGCRPRTQRNRQRGLLACFGAGLSVILSASFSLGCAGGANEAVTVTEQVSVREETVRVVKTETAPDESASVPELIAEVRVESFASRPRTAPERATSVPASSLRRS
jgi:hypothetical protein